MTPELKVCSTCPIKSAALTPYENKAGTKLNLCSPCLSRRDITKYRPKFVEEIIRGKEVQEIQ